MSSASPALLDEAIAWLVRTREPAFDDWAAFTTWLEADPDHNRAYERALDAHDAAADVRVDARPSIVVAPSTGIDAGRRRRQRWMMGATAVAATLVAGIAIPDLLPRHDRYAIATNAGEQRAVRLPDGTMIALNGATRLTLDRAHPRSVRLDGGEATFTVVHDSANPFEVEAGGTVIQDVGTVFNVVRADDATDVAVAEGAVLYDPDGAQVKLTAGRMLHDPDSGTIEIGDAEPAAIGSWRHGRLVYRGARISAIAADLSRMIGQPIVVAPEVAARSFSGTIVVRGVQQERLLSRLSLLLDVAISHDAAGWRMRSRSDSAR